jgi:hypothetical protein
VSPYKICPPSWCAKPSSVYKLEDIKNGHVYNFDGQEIVTVGRNFAATVVLPSLTVSRWVVKVLILSVVVTCIMQNSCCVFI